MIKKVAIITNGGDAPGLNAVIRAIVKTAETNGIECYGYIEGYRGLLDNNYVKLDSIQPKRSSCRVARETLRQALSWKGCRKDRPS